VSEAVLGQGRLLRGGNLEALLERAGVSREALVDRGLRFVRRRLDQRRVYFIVNSTTAAIDTWIPIGAQASTPLAVFDPMRGRHAGAIQRARPGGLAEVALQMGPSESRLIVATERPAGLREPHYDPAGGATPLAGSWTLRFIAGGPNVPPARSLAGLGSWTALAGDEVKRFSGTARYTTRFARPGAGVDAWQLDLGAVHESARVRLNGRELATLVGPQFRAIVNASDLRASNVLEVDVTNLMANRIADLDRRGVVWKRFYNVNFPSRLPENRGLDGLFTAARWGPLPSGLLGPVTMTPLAARK
jgi:hypothetical protein